MADESLDHSPGHRTASTDRRRRLTAWLGATAMAGGVVVAVSPSLTWFRGTALSRGVWSGFALYADRDELDIEGNALMMGFDADGFYNSLFGPAVPLLVGVALGFGGLVVILRRASVTPACLVSGLAVTALWSLGAAGLTGASGVEPRGDIGGAGIRAWAIGSAVAATALGVAVAWNRPSVPGSALSRRIIDWVSVPSILLAGAFGKLLYAAEEWDPFATGPVFITASLTAAVPAAGTVAALLAVAPPGRPLTVTVVNTSALILGVLLFVLWTVSALA